MNSIFTYKELGNNGRLGNQLFQIAATLAKAKKENTIAKFPEWAYSNYFKKQIDQTFNYSDVTHQYSEPWFHYSEINEEHTFFVKHDSENRVINLHGYFQSEKYFAHCKDLIKEQFDFSESINSHCNEIIKGVKQTNPNHKLVSLHLRFGDYVNNPYYAQLTTCGYYEQAVDRLFIYGEEILFVVFSDDKKLATDFMETLKALGEHKVKYIVINNTDEITDFCLMSKCDDNIIANSSFSWWASYLNKNINKIIIAPSKWFGEQANLNTKDLYTSEMIIL